MYVYALNTLYNYIHNVVDDKRFDLARYVDRLEVFRY